MTASVDSVSPSTYATSTTQEVKSTDVPKKTDIDSSLSELESSLADFKISGIEIPEKGGSMLQHIERLVLSLIELVSSFMKLGKSSGEVDDGGDSGSAPPANGGVSAPPPSSSEPDPTSGETPVETPTTDPETPPTDSPEEGPSDVVIDDPQGPSPTKPVAVGSLLPKSGEFLWKPVSDKDGKLAILLPKKLTGKVKEIRILSADKKKTLAKGTYSGVGNGSREHYRFSKSGAKFPKNAIVVVTLKDGTKYHVKIGKPSERIER